MGKVVRAHALANNEVAYVAWEVDAMIDDCLGFEVVRVHHNADGTEERVSCAAWLPFKGQRNPHRKPQSTSVWPVQKLSWRDLTLRKRRDGTGRRRDDMIVSYEIRPLGPFKEGLERAPDPTPAKVDVPKRDAHGKPIKDAQGGTIMERVDAYEGKPRALGYLAPPFRTAKVEVKRKRGQFQSAFTNGMLSAQWLRGVLFEDGVKEPDELIDMISDPENKIRKYLAGDVIPMLRAFMEREGTFLIALYELEDEELVDLLLRHKDRIRVILANTGLVKGRGWDVRNSEARKRLVEAGVDIQHRMFNNSTHIGHNKLVVQVRKSGKPSAVFTGSTNWTATGVAGQTNNALVIEHDEVAAAFERYWKRLFADEIAVPDELDDGMPSNQQSKKLRLANETPDRIEVGSGVTVDLWFSPNMQARTKGTKPPPDLQAVYKLMRQAEDAILFLAFYPSQRGRDSIVGEAIDIGVKDQSLMVTGAVSSAQAMPNYVPDNKNDRDDPDDDEEGESPHTFFEGNVSVVRASKIDDRMLLEEFGGEELTAKGGIGAIIHDKIVVIDPLSDDCAVILGSHNLGFKASYCNDENLVIVRGDKALAQAYAVHVLDVYDHYRFRAIEAERRRMGQRQWSGFLEIDDRWLADYVEGRKSSALMRYFARGG